MTRRRAAAVAAVVLVAVAAAAALRGSSGGREAQAEFADVHGLGARSNQVRVQGAPAGSVANMKLTRRGTVLMTMSLDASVPRLRRDAAVAIRPLDIFGDYYVSLSPGREREPLEGPIPLERTALRPQLDDFLRAFGPPVRTGLQALIVELGTGLERRGVDLSRAAVELRPALAATDGLVRELASQRADLRSLVTDAQRATGQLARRDRELGRLVDGLTGTLAATARRERDLDVGLARLPGTLARLESTSGRLERTARAARPVVAVTGEAAPDLDEALERAPGFVAETERTARATRPALRRARELLGPLSPVARDLARSLPVLRALGPELERLADAGADSAPDIAQGALVQVPETVSEPGEDDPRRRRLRVANVLSCESFGRRIEPGCLNGVRAGGRTAGAKDSAAGKRMRRRAEPSSASTTSSGSRRDSAGGRPTSRLAGPAQDRFVDYLLGP